MSTRQTDIQPDFILNCNCYFVNSAARSTVLHVTGNTSRSHLRHTVLPQSLFICLSYLQLQNLGSRMFPSSGFNYGPQTEAVSVSRPDHWSIIDQGQSFKRVLRKGPNRVENLWRKPNQRPNSPVCRNQETNPRLTMMFPETNSR